MTKRKIVATAVSSLNDALAAANVPIPDGPRFYGSLYDLHIERSGFPGCCQITVLEGFPFHDDHEISGTATTFEKWLDDTYTICGWDNRKRSKGTVEYSKMLPHQQGSAREAFLDETSSQENILQKVEDQIRNRPPFCLVTLNEDQRPYVEPILLRNGFNLVFGPGRYGMGKKNMFIYVATGAAPKARKR